MPNKRRGDNGGSEPVNVNGPVPVNQEDVLAAEADALKAFNDSLRATGSPAMISGLNVTTTDAPASDTTAS